MTELQLFLGQKLIAPTSASWLHEIRYPQLLALKVGELLWIYNKDNLECIKVTAPSHQCTTMVKPVRKGIQINYGNHNLTSTRFVEHEKPSGLYKITDLYAAGEHYAVAVEDNGDTKVVQLQPKRGSA